MYVLGSTYLDTEKQLLVTAERTVALQRKPYLVLLHLIENRHRMITREELLQRFWDGQEVYDQSVSKAIGSIRKAFGETKESSRFIETRWGGGYRYVGPFSSQSSAGPSDALNPGGTSVSAGILKASAVEDEQTEEIEPTPGKKDEATENVELVLKNGRGYRVYLATAVIAAAALTSIVAIDRLRNPSETEAVTTASSAEAARSVAVLPFQVDRGSTEDTYLGVGFSDAIADRLKSVEQLTVRSSSTIRTVVGTEADAKAAAEKLRVQSIVEGNLHREAGKIIVKVRVLGPTGAEFWSGTFSANNENIFSAQDSIARQVLTAILPQVGGQPSKPSAGPETAKYDAYEKYMKAEFFATNRSRSSLTKAVELLNDAIAIDPNYARAYASLANTYQLIGFYEYLAPSEAYPKAEEAARKALSLDKSNAEAHVAMLVGAHGLRARLGWRGTRIQGYRGDRSELRGGLSILRICVVGDGTRRRSTGGDETREELDPVSPSVQTSLAWALFFLRRNEESARECKRALELYPDFIPAHQLLGIVYGQLNDASAALAEFSEAEALERDNPVTLILMTFELARSGKKAEARQALQGALARPGASVVPDYYIAASWSEIGDKAKALESLRRAEQHHSNWLIYLPYDPRFDALRSDPAFRAAFQKIGTPKDVSLSAQE